MSDRSTNLTTIISIKCLVSCFIALQSRQMQRTLHFSSSKQFRTLQPGLSAFPENLTTLLHFWKNCIGYLLNLSYISVTLCMTGFAPNYLLSAFRTRGEVSGGKTRNSQLLYIPLFKTAKSGQRAFFYRIVSLWNNLDNFLKLYNSARNLKRKLRAKLFAAFLSYRS